MRRLLFALLAATAAGAVLAQTGPVVRLVEFEGPITPISARRITQAIDDAERAGETLVLIELDTPGGLVDSMEGIVKRMLAAHVPTVVWVGPSGAKAASAGFFVLIAADVAAMAPGTRAGAASPVFSMGENTKGNVLLEKANQDLAALLRSIADRRGRNAKVCEEAVFSARAFEERVALEQGLVDLVAADREDLLRQLEGREIRRFDGSTVVLHTAGAQIMRSEFSFRHRFLERLATPAVASILLLLGVLGIYMEFSHPGGIFPGLVGALCLLLFALTAQVLPVSTIGLLLILLAVVMFVLELKIASHGLLTLGGTISLVIGAMMLIEGPIPELRVPLRVVLPTALGVAALCAFAVRLAVRAQREAVTTGVEGLVGACGEVTRDLAPRGRISIHGEIWNAQSTGADVVRGTRVRVVRVEDLWLTVEPLDGPTAE